MDIRFIDGTAEFSTDGLFCARKIFDCGQAFRWNENEGVYTGIAYGKLLHCEEKDGVVRLYPCGADDYDSIWKNYFDMDRDYAAINEKLSGDSFVKKGIEYGKGIRLLNQDAFETTISFIISANNNIGRIKGIIERLCRVFGKKLSQDGEEYFCFPAPQALANAEIGQLMEIGAGYRAPYIKNTSTAFAEGFDIVSLGNMPYYEAKASLQKLAGVGPKVADCILLFSLGHRDAFPADVWIKRVLQSLYFPGNELPRDIYTFAKERFGEDAGLAQQYLFFYARENKHEH